MQAFFVKPSYKATIFRKHFQIPMFAKNTFLWHAFYYSLQTSMCSSPVTSPQRLSTGEEGEKEA